MTKHSVGVWSTVPSTEPYRRIDTHETTDASPKRAPAGLIDGQVTLEATSVSFERDGSPALGLVSAITDDGNRALANSRDADLLRALTTEPWEGRRVKLTNDGTTNEIVV